jgi:hypothetical protein
MVGTIGGQSPSFTSDRISARAGLVRDDRRVNPPLSTMSTSAGLTETPLANPAGDGSSVCALALGRFAHLRSKLLEIRRGRVEGVLALQFSAKSDLQQLGCWKSAPLQFVVEIVWQVHLKSGHTPNSTPMIEHAPP